MTYAADNTTKECLEKFQSFDVDTQLALLWFGYLDLKEQLNPANSTAAQATAGALYDQVREMSPEQQLQAQRDIIGRTDNEVSHSYKSLSSSAKLDLWLRLAQGMDEGTIIQVPSGYELPSNTQDFANSIKQLDFEQRINFMKSAVMEMGAQ